MSNPNRKAKADHPSRANPIIINQQSQYEAISSPIRDQILQVVINQAGQHQGSPPDEHGVSIREIAHQLGRKPGSLYRHIDTLVEAKLIELAGTHLTGGRDAQGYIARGDVVHLHTPKSAKGLDEMCKYIERSTKAAGIETARATRQHAKDHPGGTLDTSDKVSLKKSPQSDHAMIAMFGWLDPAQQQALHEHFVSIAQIFENASRRPDTKLIATNLQIRPVRLPDGSTPSEPG